MQESESPSLARRLLVATGRAAKVSGLSIWHVIQVVVPMSLLVSVLEWTGLLPSLLSPLAGLTHLVGLPVQAVLVLGVSLFFNLYGALSVLAFLSFNLREATILAIFCLIAHGLPLETIRMKKAGSSRTKMIALRIFLGLAAVWVYSRILPQSMADSAFSSAPIVPGGDLLGLVTSWAPACLRLTLSFCLIIFAFRIILAWLEEFRVIEILSKILSPFMRFLGLSSDLSLLWLVINLWGYSQGAAIMAEWIKDGKKKPQEGDLFNHHAAVCHSLLRDTALLVVLGAPLFWITLPRLALAVLVTWIERIRRHYFRRSFRAGVA